MGRYDSSLTRVQPIFAALYEADQSGASWLPKLLGMGGRGSPEVVGVLEREPQYEFPAEPPRDFLRWLINHPSEVTTPSYRTSEHAAEMRKRLVAGDEEVMQQALAAIDSDASHRHQWWALE